MKAPNGAGSLTRKGYRKFHVNGREQYGHVLVAERALGKPLPKDAQIHHINEKKADNRPSNLVICPNAIYHRLLHKRAEAFDACGNVDWRKCYICQKHDDPLTMTGSEKRGYLHHKCVNADQKRRRDVRNGR